MLPMTFGGKPLEHYRERMPLFVNAIERLDSELPELLALPNVRRLFLVVFLRIRSDLVTQGANSEPLSPHDEPAIRAALIYLSNVSDHAAILNAYIRARRDALASAGVAPRRRQTTRIQLKLAVASIMAGVRQARASRHCVGDNRGQRADS